MINETSLHFYLFCIWKPSCLKCALITMSGKNGKHGRYLFIILCLIHSGLIQDKCYRKNEERMGSILSKYKYYWSQKCKKEIFGILCFAQIPYFVIFKMYLVTYLATDNVTVLQKSFIVFIFIHIQVIHS